MNEIILMTQVLTKIFSEIFLTPEGIVITLLFAAAAVFFSKVKIVD